VAKVSAQRSAEPLSGFTSVSGSLIEAIHRFVAVALKVGIESKTTQLSNQCKRHPGTPGRHFVT